MSPLGGRGGGKGEWRVGSDGRELFGYGCVCLCVRGCAWFTCLPALNALFICIIFVFFSSYIYEIYFACTSLYLNPSIPVACISLTSALHCFHIPEKPMAIGTGQPLGGACGSPESHAALQCPPVPRCTSPHAGSGTGSGRAHVKLVGRLPSCHVAFRLIVLQLCCRYFCYWLLLLIVITLVSISLVFITSRRSGGVIFLEVLLMVTTIDIIVFFY